MIQPWRKQFGLEPPLFDPEDGFTVIEPPGAGPGWWAGACSMVYDDLHGFYLYYRIRKPRELGRGTDCYIANSVDGVRFQPVWHASKGDFGSESVERGALFQADDGEWRLYISYVDPADSRWRVDVMFADSPDQFDPADRMPVLTAADIGAEGVKDSVLYQMGGFIYGLFSYAPTPPALSGARAAEMHATADVYNTGLTRSHTGLAVSRDGVAFEWLGDVLSPSDSGPDAYAARISCLLYSPPGFMAFYDGGESVKQNYEEVTFLAHSLDLRHFHRGRNPRPVLTSPHGSGSLRYLDMVYAFDQLHFFYEYARPDGSHELRMNRVPWDG